jgi:hypothetical protein
MLDGASMRAVVVRWRWRRVPFWEWVGVPTPDIFACVENRYVAAREFVSVENTGQETMQNEHLWVAFGGTGTLAGERERGDRLRRVFEKG